MVFSSVVSVRSLQEVDAFTSYDIVCLSHLRWDFVYQRPQHLLSRYAQERRVFFVEEPLFDGEQTWLEISHRSEHLWVVVPHLPPGVSEEETNRLQANLLDELLLQQAIMRYVLWYYTPMSLEFSRHLEPLAIVYDCMDELSAFDHAPLAMRQCEAELLAHADLVFTGGQSLYEAKRTRHRHVYAFPSSVDTAHFARARTIQTDPPDQASIPHPRLGFYGVLDERMNFDLLGEIADAQPDWHLILVGPVAKIDPARLVKRENIHYLGNKAYTELPTYLAGWDVAIMPFAHNASTRFISPTKTLEYLAGGKRIVSTSIRDVVSPYGEQGLVTIADIASDFVDAVSHALSSCDSTHLGKIDKFLSHTSWNATWAHMRGLIEALVAERQNWSPYALVASEYAQHDEATEIQAVGGGE